MWLHQQFTYRPLWLDLVCLLLLAYVFFMLFVVSVQRWRRRRKEEPC